MKTQAVSSPNFNGQLVYMTKKGEKIVGDGIETRLPRAYNFFKKAVADSLRNEPFDVFITRGDKPLNFKVKASDGQKSTDNILVRLIKKEYHNGDSDYYNNSNAIPIAIFKSIANFKKNVLG